MPGPSKRLRPCGRPLPAKVKTQGLAGNAELPRSLGLVAAALLDDVGNVACHDLAKLRLVSDELHDLLHQIRRVAVAAGGRKNTDSTCVGRDSLKLVHVDPSFAILKHSEFYAVNSRSMVEIIPAINAETFDEVKERVRLVESHTRWVHLDVADGTFTPNVLWHNAGDLFTLDTSSLIEVHLMVAEPEKVIDAWIGAGARRIIVHVETVSNFDFIKRRCDEHKVLLTLAMAPGTSVEVLLPFMQKNVVSFQVLCVHPGMAGQEFLEESLVSIRALRAASSWCDIEVDGGMKVGIARRCKEAGANLFVAASAVFSGNVMENLALLRADVGEPSANEHPRATLS